ncbi:hypothetical protein V8D89_014890 [Ganoderma adspersum]
MPVIDDDLRRRILNPYGDKFPDDDSEKEIRLEAVGKKRAGPNDDRHVCLCWTDGMLGEGDDAALCTQVIHLTGGPGAYAFYTPQTRLDSSISRDQNTFYTLGRYTRAQREQILELASRVSYDRRSWVNGCRVWMRDLLEAMVNAGLLQKPIFEYLDSEIPLKKRVAESEGAV